MSRDVLGAGPRSAVTGMVRRAWMLVRSRAEASGRAREWRRGDARGSIRSGRAVRYRYILFDLTAVFVASRRVERVRSRYVLANHRHAGESTMPKFFLRLSSVTRARRRRRPEIWA